MIAPRHVRAATPADLPALRALLLSVRRQTFVWQPPNAFHLEDFDIQTEGERIFVAEGYGRIVGFVSLWEPDDFIRLLVVDSGHMRQGIGRALLKALPGWPDRAYRLKCLSRNRTGIEFYHAHGFVETGRGVSDEGEYIVLSFGVHDRVDSTTSEGL